MKKILKIIKDSEYCSNLILKSIMHIFENHIQNFNFLLCSSMIILDNI